MLTANTAPVESKPAEAKPVDARPVDAQAPVAAAPTPARLQAILFCSGQNDQIIDDVSAFTSLRLSDDQLLWIDIEGGTEQSVRELLRGLPLPQDAIAESTGDTLSPSLRNCGKSFWLRVVAINGWEQARFQGSALNIIAAPNIVVTLHRKSIGFIDQFRARELGQTELGRLNAASYTASLLDWQLSTYFEAVAQFEVAIERLEITILSQKPRDCLDELRTLRQAASRLRRILAPHRAIFAGIARPDFRPQEDAAVNTHFTALDTRFERAMDNVENARDLVVGSFELFSSRATLMINDSMRLLTWATVILGVLGVVLAFLQ